MFKSLPIQVAVIVIFILPRDQDELSQSAFMIFFKISIKYFSALGYKFNKHI